MGAEDKECSYGWRGGASRLAMVTDPCQLYPIDSIPCMLDRIRANLVEAAALDGEGVAGLGHAAPLLSATTRRIGENHKNDVSALVGVGYSRSQGTREVNHRGGI